MNHVLRSGLWLAFFAVILMAWVMLYGMAMQMDMSVLGLPGEMAQAMRRMNPAMDMDMPMARFGPLFAMWAVMMAAMMLPTMVPTLRSYEDLMVSPTFYFLGNWRTGFAGGLRMGLGLGSFCVGCCWGFMLLGFAGGVMNLAWMGLATLVMVLEKLPQIGHYIIKPMGVALIIGAGAVAGWPLIAGG